MGLDFYVVVGIIDHFSGVCLCVGGLGLAVCRWVLRYCYGVCVGDERGGVLFGRQYFGECVVGVCYVGRDCVGLHCGVWFDVVGVLVVVVADVLGCARILDSVGVFECR